MGVVLNFLVPSHPRYLSVVRAAVGELGSLYGLPDPDCRGIALAVHEALTNIIRHAYRGDSEQQIDVICRAYPGYLEFTLLDRGEPPDPARLAEHPLDDVALGGRGTHIIRSIMDEVCYEQVPGGNRLRLRKRLPAAESSAEGEGTAYERYNP